MCLCSTTRKRNRRIWRNISKGKEEDDDDDECKTLAKPLPGLHSAHENNVPLLFAFLSLGCGREDRPISDYLTPKCPRRQKVVASIFQTCISQGNFFSSLTFSFPLWHNKFLHRLKKINWKFYINDSKIWTLKWLYFWFFLLQNWLFWERNNVSDMNIFFFSPNYVAQILSESYQRPSNFDTFWNLYFFLKEYACKMIWWRPRIKIHIPTARMGFKMNSLEISFVCLHTIKFLIHTL